MYAIEVKESRPDISEVQEKIQYCVDTMMALLQNPNGRLRVVPVLCASAFHGLAQRTFFSYRINIFGKKVIINKRLHNEDINELVH
jgi:hypothetical protein